MPGVITCLHHLGVDQDLAVPIHPDPVSDQHCWNQKVRVERAGPTDRSEGRIRGHQHLDGGLPGLADPDPSRPRGVSVSRAAAGGPGVTAAGGRS
jgi:hypothetical protein